MTSAKNKGILARRFTQICTKMGDRAEVCWLFVHSLGKVVAPKLGRYSTYHRETHEHYVSLQWGEEGARGVSPNVKIQTLSIHKCMSLPLLSSRFLSIEPTINVDEGKSTYTKLKMLSALLVPWPMKQAGTPFQSKLLVMTTSLLMKALFVQLVVYIGAWNSCLFLLSIRASISDWLSKDCLWWVTWTDCTKCWWLEAWILWLLLSWTCKWTIGWSRSAPTKEKFCMPRFVTSSWLSLSIKWRCQMYIAYATSTPEFFMLL